MKSKVRSSLYSPRKPRGRPMDRSESPGRGAPGRWAWRVTPLVPPWGCTRGQKNDHGKLKFTSYDLKHIFFYFKVVCLHRHFFKRFLCTQKSEEKSTHFFCTFHVAFLSFGEKKEQIV
jgi:hypothetical protein